MLPFTVVFVWIANNRQTNKLNYIILYRCANVKCEKCEMQCKLPTFCNQCINIGNVDTNNLHNYTLVTLEIVCSGWRLTAGSTMGLWNWSESISNKSFSAYTKGNQLKVKTACCLTSKVLLPNGQQIVISHVPGQHWWRPSSLSPGWLFRANDLGPALCPRCVSWSCQPVSEHLLPHSRALQEWSMRLRCPPCDPGHPKQHHQWTIHIYPWMPSPWI